ncbi:MAG: ATP-binding protein [Clostridiales bacterium]|nr:MAG: ATP-binding protein [Clostridiales bacterium]
MIMPCTVGLFDEDNGKNSVMKLAKDYVNKWADVLSNNVGLLLWGNVGTGKTFFAACIANALVEQHISVRMTNFSTILNDLFSETDKNKYLERLNDHNLLIIDDLGIERDTEYALEQVYNIIDTRYKSGKPLIITTNLTLEELKNPIDVAHKRIYDRVLGMCVPVMFNGSNFRNQEAANKNGNSKKNYFGTEDKK